MAEKRVIGTCSICGGPVEQYAVLHIVGPFPPPKCAHCGATKKNPHGTTIEMEPKPKTEVHGPVGPFTSQSGTGRSWKQ